MTSPYPAAGRMYQLPSGAHVMVDKANSNDSFQCHYVNRDGSRDGLPRWRNEISLQLHFLVKHGRPVWR